MSPHKVATDEQQQQQQQLSAGLSAGPAKNSWAMGSEAFEGRMAHHDGIQALWESKWKFPCSKSVYPFHDGKLEDFAPVFAHLLAHNINDGTSAAYTEAFFPAAEALTAQADQLMQERNPKEASALYLRACCLYRIARFPYITSRPAVNDAVKWKAWQAQKEIYLRAARTWDCPVEEVQVPHIHRRKADPTHDIAGEGESIPVYVRLPHPSSHEDTSPVPVMILLTGLDGYRPDNTGRLDEFLRRGWASVTLEVPGTADCPADPADPTSPERLWDSLLAWMAAFRGGRVSLDMRRVVVWGLSCGGYYAVRMAHTHAARLAGAVGQGAGTHYFFDPAWLAHADGHEYPFLLTPALAKKHGFGDDVEQYVAEAQGKFSLLDNGILDQPSTRLLLINGTKDGLMPIEDSMLLFQHGTPKEARFFPGALHMGYPMANSAVYPWLESVMDSVKEEE